MREIEKGRRDGCEREREIERGAGWESKRECVFYRDLGD